MLMAEQTAWKGSASDLLGVLAEIAGERAAMSKTWPSNSRALSSRLRWAADFLPQIGIEFEYVKTGKLRARIIYITRAGRQNDCK